MASFDLNLMMYLMRNSSILNNLTGILLKVKSTIV